MKKIRLIAFYLPQYHPIPENDKWWGPGFTEWTNVASAKPLFRGHKQPKIPRDLGFYDLRVPETREKQAYFAKKAGIEGFCYWHYWFGNGKRLLNRPFDEVVATGKPDFPFCLGWANHSWKRKTWTAEGKDQMLIEQLYPGVDDYVNHFNTMLPAFKDKRYMKHDDGRLIFLIWDAIGFNDAKVFFETWNKLAKDNGLKGFFFIGFTYVKEKREEILKKGYDAVCIDLIQEHYKYVPIYNKIFRKIKNILHLWTPKINSYTNYSRECINYFKQLNKNEIPCILPNWDHSPRSRQNASILIGCSPQKFINLLKQTIEIQNKKDDSSRKYVFIKSWNEWGEGNYLEPDIENGTSYIDALEKFFNNTI